MESKAVFFLTQLILLNFLWRTIQTRRLIFPYGLDPQKEHGQGATFCLDVQVENQISHVIYYVYVPGS